MQTLKKHLEQTMYADRKVMRSQLSSLEKDFRLYLGTSTESDNKLHKRLAVLSESIHASAGKTTKRKNLIPKIEYDAELPIVEKKDEIQECIRNNQIVILCGETGSGKSTQLPKMLIEMGYGTFGTIGHTQPRRIAARSVAARIAEELNSPLGNLVGFKVRFQEAMSPNVLVKLMTDGILLAETQNDRFFDQYSALIIDEAHERSLNIDFLLGMLKQVAPRRKELKIIITSATIDAKRFSEHFFSAPVIEVAGRTFPIEIRYRPLDV